VSSLGLDVGGTFLKAAWLDEGPLQVIRRPIPDFLDTTGDAREIDPDQLMDAISGLLDEVIGQRECSRIFVTGQMAGLAFVDADGRAVAPLISWQDTRFGDIEHVNTALTADELARLGDGLRIGLPLVTLSHLEVPGGAYVTSLIGFVVGALIGSRARWMHATDAAAMGMLDVPACRWSSAALSVARLEPGQLPEPVADLVVAGSSQRYGAQVATAVGDQQAALLGAGLDAEQISMNIATGCQVSRLTSEPSSPAQLRPFFDGKYLQTITHLPAGRLLRDAVREHIGHEPGDSEWERAIQSASDQDSAVGRAVATIAEACVNAAQRLDPGSTILFSGGLAQRVSVLREAIEEKLSLPSSVFPGDDAALEGLRQLSRA